MTATKHLSVAISADMLSALPFNVSSVFLNDDRFASNGIAMFSSFLTRLNPSSRKNLLLAISDLTFLEMGLGKSSIDFMSSSRGVSQRLNGVPKEKIITLFTIASL